MSLVDTLYERLTRRDAALRACRAFFAEEGFLEVETPMLVEGPGLEPHIDPLEVRVRTALEGPAERRWLHTSPELQLKRVLSGLAREGREGRVFQLARVFRDGERGPLHRPEFTMLEWYRAPGRLDDLIYDCQGLSRALARALGGRPPIDLSGPFERVSVAALFKKAGVDLSAALDEEEAGDATSLARRARRAGHHVQEGASFEDAFFHLMAAVIEPGLGQDRPVVVERYPRSMAVLARVCDDDPRYAARFELYARGVELANAFDELTDPVEQRARFEEDNRQRRVLGKEALPLDEAFLAELGHLPRSAGIALGFDRLLLVLADEDDIGPVIGWP